MAMVILYNKRVVSKLSLDWDIVREFDQGAGPAGGREGDFSWWWWWQEARGREGSPGRQQAAGSWRKGGRPW